MLEYTVSAASCLLGEIGSRGAKENKKSMFLNACTRLDSVVVNVESYYGTLPIQVPIWKMVHESTAELVSEISGSWRTSVIGVVKAKTKIMLGELFLLLSPSCRERMMLFALAY